MKIIVGGIIEKDNKILMVKEAKKKCYGKWNVPAVHLENGETIFEGAIREIFEETGLNIKIVPGDKVYSWKSFSGSENYLYEVTIPADFNIKISWEHESYEWISDDELINKSAEDEFMYRVKRFLSKK